MHKKRFFSEPEGNYFLFGPRGTGKSTWLKEHHADALWINLLEPTLYRKYAARPESLMEILYADSKIKNIIIDEVQRLPELLNIVHLLIEEKKGWRFILTGSSARKLKRGGGNLLAGRALLKTMQPFMAAELGDSFALHTALRLGMLPVVLDATDPLATLESYIGVYLEEEVRAEALVRDVGDFARFLEIITFSHASQINLSNVARECQVHRKTVENFMYILEDLLLCFSIPVFSVRAKRDLVKQEKFYLFDAGVYASLRPKGYLDRQEESDGVALEGLVAQHLKAYLSYSGDDSRLFYWRTRHGVEVDFVIYGSKYFFALEVKNAERVSSQDVRNLKAFLSDYPEAKGFLLYRGQEKLLIDGVLCLPCDDFLVKLNPKFRLLTS